MIDLKNIERSYKTGAGQTWVLRRINLTIQEGEFLTIMGPSGAGKSSTFSCRTTYSAAEPVDLLRAA